MVSLRLLRTLVTLPFFVLMWWVGRIVSRLFRSRRRARTRNVSLSRYTNRMRLMLFGRRLRVRLLRLFRFSRRLSLLPRRIGLLRLGVGIGILALPVLRYFGRRKRLVVLLLRRLPTSMVRVRVVDVARRVLIRMFVPFFARTPLLVLVVMLRWWVPWHGRRTRWSRVVVRMSGLFGSVWRRRFCCRNVIRLLTLIVLLRNSLGGRISRSFTALRILFWRPRRKRLRRRELTSLWRDGIVVRVLGRVTFVLTWLGLGRIWSSRFTLLVTRRMWFRVLWPMRLFGVCSPWDVPRSRIWWVPVMLLFSRLCRRRSRVVVVCRSFSSVFRLYWSVATLPLPIGNRRFGVGMLRTRSFRP